MTSKEAAPVLRLLCEQKKLVRVKDGLYYSNEAVEEILDKVRQWFGDHEDLDVGGLKEILGLSRKYLIALLEFMAGKNHRPGGRPPGSTGAVRDRLPVPVRWPQGRRPRPDQQQRHAPATAPAAARVRARDLVPGRHKV